MKITQSDTTRLVIVHRPLLCAILFFPTSLCLLYYFFASLLHGASQIHETIGSLIGFLVCFFGAALFTNWSTFDFDLIRHQLTWRRRSLFRGNGGVVPFDQIHGARVEECGLLDESRTYPRVALVTTTGTIPLTTSYGFGSDKQQCGQICQAIDDVLHYQVARAIPDPGSPIRNAFALLGALVGLVVQGFVGHYIVKTTSAQRWPTTLGTVVDSRIVTVEVDDDHSAPQAHIRYRYEVSGRQFETDHLRYRMWNFGGTLHHYPPELARQYPTAASIPVSYDPADPSQAVIETTLSGNAYPTLTAGAALLVGAVFYLVSRATARKAAPAPRLRQS
jgi:hypothetical protein